VNNHYLEINNSNKRCSWSAAKIATLVDSVNENNIMNLLDVKRYKNADVSNKTDFLMKFK